MLPLTAQRWRGRLGTLHRRQADLESSVAKRREARKLCGVAAGHMVEVVGRVVDDLPALSATVIKRVPRLSLVTRGPVPKPGRRRDDIVTATSAVADPRQRRGLPRQ